MDDVPPTGGGRPSWARAGALAFQMAGTGRRHRQHRLVHQIPERGQIARAVPGRVGVRDIARDHGLTRGQVLQLSGGEIEQKDWVHDLSVSRLGKIFGRSRPVRLKHAPARRVDFIVESVTTVSCPRIFARPVLSEACAGGLPDASCLAAPASAIITDGPGGLRVAALARDVTPTARWSNLCEHPQPGSARFGRSIFRRHRGEPDGLLRTISSRRRIRDSAGPRSDRSSASAGASSAAC
jgi:hypothetical protein